MVKDVVSDLMFNTDAVLFYKPALAMANKMPLSKGVDRPVRKTTFSILETRFCRGLYFRDEKEDR